MRQPGVRPVTMTIGTIGRFQRSKQVLSYLGLNPSEESNGGKQRLGSIRKQGNSIMRHLLVELTPNGPMHTTISKCAPRVIRHFGTPHDRPENVTETPLSSYHFHRRRYCPIRLRTSACEVDSSEWGFLLSSGFVPHSENPASPDLVPAVLGEAVKSAASPCSCGNGASRVRRPTEPWK
jgi:hypothetical protein